MSDTEEKTRGMRLRTRLLLVLAVCALAAGAFWGGAAWSARPSQPVITSDLLGERLRAVQELVSVEYHYTNMGKFQQQADFYGWKVPFTTKSFIVSYDGVIQAGVDLGAAKVEIGAAGRSVTVTLPESKILSHEILEDSIQVFDESRNLFNPISIEDYTGFTADQKAAMAQRAVDQGLLTGANEKALLAVESLLGLLPGMEAYTLTVRTGQ